MLYTSERDKLRQFYVEAWRKARLNLPLEPMEQWVARIIEMHPEYHRLLENEHYLGHEYKAEDGETNPFLHMSMHLGLQEQVAMDRPAGIKTIYTQLGEKTGDVMYTEHLMMECLSEMMWQAQQQQAEPDEQAYLTCLQQLLIKTPKQ